MNKLLLLTLSLFCATQFYNGANAQNISRKGDTLISVPAKSYQWLKNGTIINGETNQKFVPREAGNYAVRTGDKSLDFNFLNKYANLTGLVYNEKLEPIPNVDLKVNGIATKTDANGRYKVKFPISERAIIRAEHPNFKSRTLGFLPTDAETLFKDLRLESFATTHSFDAKRSTLLGTNGFVMNMPDSAMVDMKTGQPYYGKVSAHISSHQNGDALFGEQMPGGDFLGITKEGQENVLYSFGFFSCELKGENGENLNLSKGKTAKVTFEVPANQRAKMQPTMPLWHFDESIGAWVEVDLLKKVGNSYTGEVSHFSSWNCDYSGPRSWVEGEVMACDGTNASGGTVYTEQIPVQVDSKGFYRGWIPAQWEIDMLSSTQIKQYSVPKLQPDETHKVPKFMVNAIRGFGFIDTTGYLKIYQGGGNGLVNYSVDGGKTFQSSPEFQFQKSDTTTKSCVIRDEKGCENHFKAKIFKRYLQDCELVDYNTLENEGWFSISDYLQSLQTGNPKHKFSIYSEKDFLTFQENRGWMGCLQGVGFYNAPKISESQIWESLLTSPQLQIITIQIQKLTTIPSLKNWKSLTNLFLDNNQLTSLPASVGEWKSLTNLYLGNNQLTSLPATVRQWKSLNTLNLNFNQLTSLPASVGEWKSLNWLILDNNKLTSLPAEVGQWLSLTLLDLRSNQLTSLPAEVGQWKSLMSLNLQDNQLTSLPAEIANLKDNLQHLTLNGNNFSQTEKDKVKGWLPKTNISW